MSVWSPLTFLPFVSSRPSSGGAMARRWAAAARKEPALVEDLIRMGRVLEARPVRFDGGVEAPDPIDPLRLAFEAGERNLALKLLALAHVGPAEIRDLMENTND